MGYRTRRISEHVVILQKPPIRTKGVWCLHNIRDVWPERLSDDHRPKDMRGLCHPHAKPVGLVKALIQAVTNEGDVVVDPCAGSYTVHYAAEQTGRRFLGCDIGMPGQIWATLTEDGDGEWDWTQP